MSKAHLFAPMKWVKEQFEWKLCGSAIGTTPITLPTNYNELQITVKGTTTGYQLFTFILPKDVINKLSNDDFIYLTDGADATAVGGNALSVTAMVRKTSIALASYWYNATSLKDEATTYVYYR